MAIATPPLPSFIYPSKNHRSIQVPEKPKSANSMSQDYHQGIFSFSNGFERVLQEDQHHQIAHQIRREKLRVQGFEHQPPPLVAVGEEESGGLPVYETAGMLSEMFNFPPGAVTTATVLLENNQMPPNYRNAGPASVAARRSGEWYGNRQVTGVGGLGPLGDAKTHPNAMNNRDSAVAHHPHQISSINADSAAAMQLFLTNPQPRSPSPSPSQPPPATSSTLRMLLPNSSSTAASALQGFHYPIGTNTASAGGGNFVPVSQFTWVHESGHEGGAATAAELNNPSQIGGVVEGQGLSLSLSSSLQNLGAAKAEELRMGDGGLFFFNQEGGSAATAAPPPPPPPPHPYKNLGGHYQPLHFQGGIGQNHHQVHVGFGTSIGVANVLRNSKYVKAAQELLEEFCSVGRCQVKKKKFGTQIINNNPNPNGSGGGGGGSSSSSKDLHPLSAADRIEHQRRKGKLSSMLDEVDRKYNHYCEQMQMVVNSFDMVLGFGAAVPYTALAQKAMSRHFRCLKDAIAAQLKHSCELLGDKDAGGSSGVTKGETPRLKLLEQSLRQQRAYHQMGIMEQEAWRPQRGLPERSVNILRAWLFEHFLHPYPSDADKHLLARQTGLSRNQVSNWFINARVRLWKPMVEDMYQQESKDEAEERETRNQNSNLAQTPTPPSTTTTSASATAPPPSSSINPPTARRSEINALDSDPSLIAINTHCFSENQAKHASATATLPTATIPTSHDADTNRRRRIAGADYGTTAASSSPSGNAENVGSTLVRFGTASGDVSLTLGLRHAGDAAGEESFLS